ncbi:MAG: FkbM family methyltransferase [Bacteroidetes bacterium]|nr:FkbM family methyltransferase [Bacteroidota bacterium]
MIQFFRQLKFILKSLGYYFPFIRKCVELIVSNIERLEKKILFFNKNIIEFPISKKSKIFLEKDTFISHLMLKDFEYEERFLVAQLLNKEGHFFDIGANIGLYSIIASETIKNYTIYAFEPTSFSRKKLAQNIELNQIQNVEIIPNAVSSEDFKTQQLYINQSGFDVFNSLLKPISGNYLTEKVETITLDTFIHQLNIDCQQIQFIKMDVEGLELEVLQGASNLLLKHPKILYMIEFNEDFRKSNKCKNVFQLLNQYKYKCYFYNHAQKKLINIETIKENISGNFFCIHISQTATIKQKLLPQRIVIIDVNE